MPSRPRRPSNRADSSVAGLDDEHSSKTTPKERAVPVGIEPWRLAGLLTLPPRGDACPALTLLHGSGPNDRDHSVGPHRTFCDLAHGLARRGVATLRYDNRSFAYAARLASQLAPDTTLHEEAVIDGLLAHELLGRQACVRPDRRFVLGYSLGGLAAVRLAQLAPTVRGLIIVASSPRPFEDCLLDQAHYLASLEGAAGDSARTALPDIERDAERIKAINGGSPPQLHEQLLGTPASYWIDLAAHPIAATLSTDPRPLLVVHPGRDFQVGDADLDGWRTLLESHPAAELRCYEQLNHLLVEGSAPSTPAEWRQAGPLHSAVLDDIATWIERVG